MPLPARALLPPAIAGKNPAAMSRTGTPVHAGETGASMKHPSIRELFDYWNKRRGGRPAPERGEIEPGAIRHVLADTFILAFDAGAGHPFRIAGTRVCALFGRELKGAAFWTCGRREPGRGGRPAHHRGQ